MDYKEFWESVLLRLAPTLGKAHILSFFKDSIVVRVENGVLVVAAPTQISYSFIRDRYEVKILQMAKELDSSIREIRIEILGMLADQDHPHKIDLKKFQMLQSPDVRPGARKVPNRSEVFIEDGVRSKMLNPRYTLNSFIPGEENSLAHAACMAVVAKPGGIYNPLFLYGDVGLGKTHLLQGTGLEILKKHPRKNVVYMTSERFINEIVEAIGKKNTKSFKDRYRNVDCFAVDDIQFFGNKASSQAEFFHTFNELYDAGKQIILSSDRSPHELDGLEQRLKSRFGMGMVVEVRRPEFETRMAILRSKCQEHQALLDPEVLEFIAYNVPYSIRELEGVLVKAIGEAELTHTTPTIQSVADAIRRLNKGAPLQGPGADSLQRSVSVRTPDDLLDLVAAYFKVTRSDLIGEVRRKEFMVPRQVCMYLIREVLDCSYETIGEYFGGRNHTTVLHSCHKVLLEMEKNTRIRRDVNALKKEMGVATVVTSGSAVALPVAVSPAVAASSALVA